MPQNVTKAAFVKSEPGLQGVLLRICGRRSFRKRRDALFRSVAPQCGDKGAPGCIFAVADGGSRGAGGWNAAAGRQVEQG